MLQLTDIRKRFGPTVALDGVTLRLAPGQVHALIGENGAGKSTLMNIVAGALQPDAGRMSINNEPYAPSSPLDARRHGIALIHQELSLCPHLTVAENILMGIEPSRFGWLDRSALRKKALEVLESFHHPEIQPERRIADLPIAARQLVEICRAIAARAAIVLMDEPTSSLQRQDVERLFGLIRKLSSEGIGIVYISHFLEEIREIADSYTVLRDGRSVSDGPLASVSNGEIIGQMVGRPVENLFPPRTRVDKGETVLSVSNLSAPPALKHASFELKRGEILGISGLIGSGRTEMVRALFGLDPVESGTVTVRANTFGLDRTTPSRSLVQGFGYLSEDRKGEGLALSLSVADNITMTRFDACSRWGWIDVRGQRRQADRWISELGIKAREAFQIARTLSGGNQQKVALGRLLHQDADILLLDEPTRGIDIGSKVQIYEMIARCASQNKAVLMISSYLPELFGLCDRLAVMSRGRLTAARPIAEWTPESVLQAAIGEGEKGETMNDER